MFLKKLNLQNFRNYSNLSLEFDKRPTILLGNNAVGKSNLLESVYFLSTTKSQRVETEVELIKEGEDFSRVGAEVYEIGSVAKQSLEITLQSAEGQFGKRVKMNGIPRRVVDFVGNLPAVIFYPSDINMVRGAPALRRWHLDLALVQVDLNYKKTLTLYEQILTNRNRILKKIREGVGKMDELNYWTEELISNGRVISEKRKNFFDFVNKLEKFLGNFKFEYMQSELVMDRLFEYSSREIAAAMTLIGPHRDDFRITLADTSDVGSDSSDVESGTMRERDLAHFGSRGEQRTATLAFKLAQLEFMANKMGIRPILLLDDVFSELDGQHRASVIEIVGKQQTIIATVELEHIPKKFLDGSRILRVNNGVILSEAK